MSTTTNIHNVESIKVKSHQFGGDRPFISTEFTFTDKNGDYVTVSAFSREALTIDGAEMVNLIAATQGETA